MVRSRRCSWTSPAWARWWTRYRPSSRDGGHVVVQRVAEARSARELDHRPLRAGCLPGAGTTRGWACSRPACSASDEGHMTYYLTVTRASAAPLLAFSTLACPEWSPLEVVARAAEMGFGGIEWRGGPDGHAGPHLSPADRRAVRAAMDERGLVAVSVTTYTDFVHPDAAVRAASVNELVEHAQVALALGAPRAAGVPGRARRRCAARASCWTGPRTGLLAAEAAIGRQRRLHRHRAPRRIPRVTRHRAVAGACRADPASGSSGMRGNTWSIGERPGYRAGPAAAVAPLHPAQGWHGPVARLAL